MILAGGVAVVQADVQVMGHIDESINYIDGSNSPYVDKGDTETRFICTTCSIGFKGSEDLGNGLKALFFLDWQYDINGNGNGAPSNGGLSGRDQYLGLGGNFGTLKAGTMSTLYKSYGAMLDPAYRTIAQQRDIGLQSGLHRGRGSDGQGRATNTVRYDTPNWNGLKGGLTYTIRPDSDAPPSHDNPMSAGVSYENGGILLTGAYLSNFAGGDDQAFQLGAKYTLNNFSVFGQYEFDKGLITDQQTETLGQNNTGDGADVWMVGATYTMGNNMLYAAYGQGDNAKTQNNVSQNNNASTVSVSDYKAWEIVGIHNFSKRTLGYLGYVGNNGITTNGLDWGGTTGTSKNDFDGVAHYTVGVKHTF
jgi:predicted porin